MTFSIHPRRMVPLLAVMAVSAIALAAVACGSGTSSSDKTSTAAAGAGGASSSPAAQATTASSSANETSAYATQTAAAGASGTPAAGTTAAAPGGGGAAMVNAMTAPSALMDETGASVMQYLTDEKGNTLYYFKNDVANSGKSAVPASIAANWPPFTTTGAPAAGSGVSGTLGTFTGPDGSMWVTYNGKPLYYYKGDSAPGDTKGEGLAGIWYVVGP